MSDIKSENITPIYLDITDDSSIDKLIEFVKDKKISIIINCAGGSNSYTEHIYKQNRSNLIEAFNLNTASTLSLINQMLPYIDMDNDPIIINITSIAGHEIFNADSAYTIAKHSQSIMSKILRKDLSPMGIRVTELAPSSVNSIRNNDLFDRTLEPEDIADLIFYICSVKKHVDINYISIGHVKELPFLT